MRWEIVKTLLGVATVFGSVFWGYTTYVGQAKFNREQHFLEAQVDRCLEASKVAASIATVRDKAIWEQARGRFFELYYGDLVVVEDRDVANEMIKFKDILGLESQFNDLTGDSRSKLRGQVLNIAKKCRALIERSWRVKLAALNVKF